MIGDYNLEPLVYGVHNGGVRLVDLVEAPLGIPTIHIYYGDTKYNTANQHCLHLFTLQVIPASGADSPEAYQNLLTNATQVSTVV